MHIMYSMVKSGTSTCFLEYLCSKGCAADNSPTPHPERRTGPLGKYPGITSPAIIVDGIEILDIYPAEILIYITLTVSRLQAAFLGIRHDNDSNNGSPDISPDLRKVRRSRRDVND